MNVEVALQSHPRIGAFATGMAEADPWKARLDVTASYVTARRNGKPTWSGWTPFQCSSA